jgi:hypothetical protein
MSCQCEQEGRTGFCPVHQTDVPARFRQYCGGTSGLPRWKELFYLRYLVTKTASVEPTFAEKTKNFLEAIDKHIASGFSTVSDADRLKRLAVCGDCEHRKADGTCELCGCVLEAKAAWATEDCPDGKWPKPLVVVQQESGRGGCGCGR